MEQIDLKTTQTTNTAPKLTPVQQAAFEKVIALRRITRETQTITTKAQSYVLQSLSSADLTEVALALQQHGW